MWEYLKKEIRKFSKKFCEAARFKKIESSSLETKLKIKVKNPL